MTSLFSISLINFLQAKIEKQMNLNMNIQTVLSKYPSNLSDKANEVFTRPADYANSQNDFFEEIFTYVSVFYIYPSENSF
jgi:hypothetical protein